MTPADRFDRLFANLLVDLAEPRYPSYIDDALEVATRGSQRPAWTFPERWIPMTALTRATPLAPGLPWRRLTVLAILVLLAGAVALAAFGSRQRLAPPFGPAANGLMAYQVDGNIYARDLASGQVVGLAEGVGIDVSPSFSRDGSRLAFARLDPATAGTVRELATLYVANPDGSDARPLMGPELIQWVAWAPSSQEIAVLSTVDRVEQISLVSVADGSRRTFAAGVNVLGRIDWRPPDGRELVFRGAQDGSIGVFAIRPDGSDLRTISPPGAQPRQVGQIALTPDGRSLVYMSLHSPYHIRVLDLDTGMDRPFGAELPVPAGGPGAGDMHAGGQQLSADGTKVVFGRYWDEHSGSINHQIWVASLAADGADAVPISPVVRSQAGSDPFIVAVSPAGTEIVIHRADTTTTWVVDFDGRNLRTVDWGTFYDPDWQRLPLP